MSRTLTIRLTKELAEWLAAAAATSGLPQATFVSVQLERIRAAGGSKGFLRLAGCVCGPKDLSARNGFSRR